MRLSSSSTSRSMRSRSSGRGAVASSSIATRMRASGLRSSWDAEASNVRCTETSDSMRAAARLKLSASAATSSQPSTSTRALKSPAPSASTRVFSRSSRRVIARASGYAPMATSTTRATSSSMT